MPENVRIKSIIVWHTQAGEPNERKIIEEIEWRTLHGWRFVSRCAVAPRWYEWLFSPGKRGHTVLKFERIGKSMQ